MRYIYGPVNSRRLGLSLGISLTPHKICSFDCIYCQLGRTTAKTSQREEYLKIGEVLDELKIWLADNPVQKEKLNYITFSGLGEPTLNVKIGELIQEIKQLTPVPVAVITNASLLSLPLVRQALSVIDLIVPTLNTASEDIFLEIDRPAEGIQIKEIIKGLADFSKDFRGKIWLEVMLVKGINDDLRQIKKLKEAIDKINPDKVQLNSPVRTTSEPNVLAVAGNKLQKIKEILGGNCEII